MNSNFLDGVPASGLHRLQRACWKTSPFPPGDDPDDVSLSLVFGVLVCPQFPRGFDMASAQAWQGVAFLIFQLYMNVNALLVNAVIFVAFSLLSVTQICSVVACFTHATQWARASGYFGLATALVGKCRAERMALTRKHRTGHGLP